VPLPHDAPPHDLLPSAVSSLPTFAVGNGALWMLAANHRAQQLPPSVPSKLPALLRRQRVCVLDLDNTLISRTRPDAGSREHVILTRPGASALLKRLHSMKHVDTVLFTASSEENARPKVESLERAAAPFKFAATLFRDATVRVNGTFVKDLRLFVEGEAAGCPSPRTLADVVHSVFAGAHQPDNIIPVSHWSMEQPDCQSDNALELLGNLLEVLLAPDVPDVRPSLRALFNLRGRMEQVFTGTPSMPPCGALPERSSFDAFFTEHRSSQSHRPAGCTCLFNSEHSLLISMIARLRLGRNGGLTGKRLRSQAGCTTDEQAIGEKATETSVGCSAA